MLGNRNNYNGQFEIKELIDDAVKNALSRRNQAIDSENTLSDLSSEEAGNVAGGQVIIPITPIITGIIAPDYPPIA